MLHQWLFASVRTPFGVAWQNVLDVAVVFRLGHPQITEQELEPGDNWHPTDTERQRDFGHRLELAPADCVGTWTHVQQRYRHGAWDVTVQVSEGGGCTSLLDGLNQTQVCLLYTSDAADE